MAFSANSSATLAFSLALAEAVDDALDLLDALDTLDPVWERWST